MRERDPITDPLVNVPPWLIWAVLVTVVVVLVVLLWHPAKAHAEPPIVATIRNLIWPPKTPKVETKEPAPSPVSRPKQEASPSRPPASAAAETSRRVPASDAKAKAAGPTRQVPPPKPAKEKQKQVGTQPASDQPGPARATCKPISVNCTQICEHAWMGETAGIALGVAWGYCRPTENQKAQGKACVRRHCPRWLT